MIAFQFPKIHNSLPTWICYNAQSFFQFVFSCSKWLSYGITCSIGKPAQGFTWMAISGYIPKVTVVYTIRDRLDCFIICRRKVRKEAKYHHLVKWDSTDYSYRLSLVLVLKERIRDGKWKVDVYLSIDERRLSVFDVYAEIYQTEVRSFLIQSSKGEEQRCSENLKLAHV